MTLAMNSLDASSQLTKTSEKPVPVHGAVAEATSKASQCVVFRFDDHTTPRVETPPNHVAVGDMVAKWEKDEQRGKAIKEARAWVADTFHAEDGDTVRTLRLRKGWSQIQLSKELGTSQSHVARIERGTENLVIETCRRLCGVLGIDMNTLDQALRRQEAIAQAKAKQ